MFRRITSRLQVGVEWNPGANEVGPVANWIMTPETEKWPMVSLGTSSDRIFSPPGFQSYYLTFGKSIPGLPVAPYVSLFYSEWERKMIFPFGVNIALTPAWDFLPMNDGRNTHLLLTHKFQKSNISLMLIKMRHPGLSLGFSF